MPNSHPHERSSALQVPSSFSMPHASAASRAESILDAENVLRKNDLRYTKKAAAGITIIKREVISGNCKQDHLRRKCISRLFTPYRGREHVTPARGDNKAFALSIRSRGAARQCGLLSFLSFHLQIQNNRSRWQRAHIFHPRNPCIRFLYRSLSSHSSSIIYPWFSYLLL